MIITLVAEKYVIMTQEMIIQDQGESFIDANMTTKHILLVIRKQVGVPNIPT